MVFQLIQRSINRAICKINGAQFGKTSRWSSNKPRAKQLNTEPSSKLIWIDMEMSGLDPDKDKILEFGCLITDGVLNLVAEGPNLIIHQPDDILENMDSWCTQHHTKSGLIEQCKRSNLTEEKAEEEILNFLSTHTTPGSCPLAGNSVYMDKFFLMKHLPRVANYLHFRIVDVSSIKELIRRWYPQQFLEVPRKRLTHRAVSDIYESLEELKYYKEHFFINPLASR